MTVATTTPIRISQVQAVVFGRGNEGGQSNQNQGGQNQGNQNDENSGSHYDSAGAESPNRGQRSFSDSNEENRRGNQSEETENETMNDSQRQKPWK